MAGITPDRCSIEECDKPISSRTWCQMHYTRWKRHGDPLIRLNGNGVTHMRGRLPTEAAAIRARDEILANLRPSCHQISSSRRRSNSSSLGGKSGGSSSGCWW